MKENTLTDIKNEFKRLKDNQEFVITKDGVKTVEIINADFVIGSDETAIFGEVNEYVERELEWYLSQSLNVFDIPGKCPKIWENVADEDGNINSNYGWCIFNPMNFYQYKNCLEQLIEEQTTRRASMIYARPSMQLEWNYKGKSDFICTFATQQFIRNNKLHYIVLMRSNDAVFGFKNDLFWHRYVANRLIYDLHKACVDVSAVPVIHWHANSLHVYERHFNLIDEYQYNN